MAVTFNVTNTRYIFFTTLLFLSTYQNIISEVFLTGVDFLYTINGVHDEVISLPNGK